MKLNIKFLYGGLIFLAFTFFACAPNVSSIPEPTGEWVPVGETQDKNIISIDTGKYSKRDVKATVWVRVDYRTPPQPKLNASQFYAQFNCQQETFEIYRTMQLDTQGERLEDKLVDTEAQKVAPGSIEGVVLEKVCFEHKAPEGDRKEG
ncbi:MAG TPA: hypothetical protein DDZ80_00055 [Cyanobacteria bacterium UBA8803]|nr:hypothetical protein [Cyanobacteria bacterium UBA9273]HBL57010.1 hypothetical protein [Cyanobacteria bacterium UBA8803]